MKYCLDANTLIEAHRRYYALETFPVFWSWLLENTETLGSIGVVYRELTFSDEKHFRWSAWILLPCYDKRKPCFLDKYYPDFYAQNSFNSL